MKRIIIFVACLLPGMYAVWLGGYIIGRDMERARHVAPSSAAVKVECKRGDGVLGHIVWNEEKPRAKVTPLGIGGPTTGMDTYIVPVDGHSLKKKAVKPSADKYFLTLGIPEGYQLWCADYQNCMLEKKP